MILGTEARTKTVEIVVVLGEFSRNSTWCSFPSSFSLSFFPPSLFHWDIFANDYNSPKCHSFNERQSKPHGSLVTLVGGSEHPQAENPELEPCVLCISALGSEHLRSHSVQCCTTFSYRALNKNSCGCCLLRG